MAALHLFALGTLIWYPKLNRPPARMDDYTPKLSLFLLEGVHFAIQAGCSALYRAVRKDEQVLLYFCLCLRCLFLDMALGK